MKIILNKTKNSSERYTLIDGSMGNYGEPSNHANHKFQIVSGSDRGHGYQGYTSVSYFLTQSHVLQEAKDKVKAICKEHNLIY
jgi:hypothetical protein